MTCETFDSLEEAVAAQKWYKNRETERVQLPPFLESATAQQQKLQALPPGQLAQITKGGQTYYVFPDAANNRAFVGGPDQYQALVNYRLSQHLAAEQLATSTAYADPSLGWDTWNG